MENCKYWNLYEKGIDYINKKQLITRTNKCWNFFSGRQWEGVEADGDELPFLNFIKPIIKHKVSTVSQNTMVAHFSDAMGDPDKTDIYARLDQLFSQAWEHANMDSLLWSTIKDAAVTGDGILYFGTKHMADVQKLMNTTVLYGDESETDIQKQPYIIVYQRIAVDLIRKQAEENGLSDEEIALIRADSDTENLVGNREEVELDTKETTAKSTVIFYFTKVDGIVNVAKCTRSVIFEPLHPVQATEHSGAPGNALKLYPFVKISWEDYPNDARGLSEVEQLIPNQLVVNKTLARIELIIKLTAYPRIVYDANSLTNPEELMKVGTPLEMSSGGVQSVRQVIDYLEPAQANGVPKSFVDSLIEYTQELSGSGETAMGNINPTRVAASAIIAIRDQAALPLNEQVAKMKTFVEDFARLAVEIWSVYNPNGIDVPMKVLDPLTNEEVTVLERISKADWDEIRPVVRIDTSQDSPWTKEAEQNWLDGVLDKQLITFEEYVEAASDNGIIPKQKMEKLIAKRKQMQQQQMLTQEAEFDPVQSAMEQWDSLEGQQ